MTKTYFVILFVVCLFSARLNSAEYISVIFNGKDCGSLKQLSITGATVIVDAEACSDQEPSPEPPPEPPPEVLIDPACTATPSICGYFELPIDRSTNYEGHINPGHRAIYHFKSPVKTDLIPPNENRLIRFTVVDHGAEVSINLGISQVKGRIKPEGDDSAACFTGPGTELSLVTATDETYTKCVMAFETDYYFTIENLDATITGGYILEFNKGGEY